MVLEIIALYCGIQLLPILIVMLIEMMIVGVLFGQSAIMFIVSLYILQLGIIFLREFSEADNIERVSLALFLLVLYSFITGEFQIISALFLIFLLAGATFFVYALVRTNVQEELNDQDKESEYIKCSRDQFIDDDNPVDWK